MQDFVHPQYVSIVSYHIITIVSSALQGLLVIRSVSF